MSLKKKIVGGVIPLSLSFTLMACASAVENVLNASENVDSFTSEIVNQFNGMKDLEAEVQTSFEDALANDPELESFKNEKASVFENVDLRQESLDAIKVNTEDLAKIQKNLNNIKDKQVDSESVNQLLSDLDSTLNVLNSYTENYQTYLDTQKEYFKSLGQEDASYENFVSGIDQMKEQDQQLIEIENNLNNQLATLQESAKKAKDKATEIQEENGKGEQ